MILQMSDADLLARLRNCEDQFVERKTVGDLKDCLKTVFAFAKSAPIGMPCVLYVGVKDDGQFEDRRHDFDCVQKSLNRLLQNIYPRAAYFPKLRRDQNGFALAVIVPGSELRPHFSGPSYIRVGSESIEASQREFDALIAMRSGKVYRLAQQLGKQVSVINNSLLGNGTFM
jgi:predicted HTH transcriptional regulator